MPEVKLSFNRTILVLKWERNVGRQNDADSFNRTILVLKLKFSDNY